MDTCINKRKIREIIPIINTDYDYDFTINEKRWIPYPTEMKETVVTTNHTNVTYLFKRLSKYFKMKIER